MERFSVYRNFKEEFFNSNYSILIIKYEKHKLRKSQKNEQQKLQICQTNETVIQKSVYSLQSRVLEISTQHSICFIKQVRSVLGEILLKMNLKLDGDIMVNFEPGEYMRMFLQSVTQVAGKKKVLPIRVKPTTFWLLESRICTNNQKVACVQIPPPPPLRKNRRRTRQGKRGNRLQTLFPFFALLPRSLALARVLVNFRKKQKTTYVYRLDQQFLLYLTAGFTDLNDSQSLVGYLQVSGPKFYRDLCPPEKRKEWLSNFASKQDYKVYT